MAKKLHSVLCGILAAVVSLGFTVLLLLFIFLGTGIQTAGAQNASMDVAVGERFGMYMTNQISNALEGILDIKKVYWLSDDDVVAPKPNQDLFGTTDSPSNLGWFLEDAQELLDGQQTLFSTDTVIAPNTEIHYYLDETIMVVTWKEAIADTMYTISEVKILHPSQFRRFLSGGSYGSGIQIKASEMANSVNAVVASNGDYYAHRREGISVYNRKVHRVDSEYLDTCYIDDNGDMIFSYRRNLKNVDEAQKFVDDNNVRFSLSFGPVLIEDGKKIPTELYAIGDILNPHFRAALCQMGPLHYLLVTAGLEAQCGEMVTVSDFQDVLMRFGCERAYNLDGGQTAAIIMEGEVINTVSYGEERNVSDIIYFATALPNNEGTG